MERHRCKLCFRRFSSGRALGGHMRSHVTPRPTRAPPLPPSPSASSSSSSAADAAAAGLGYGLRENPRKSFRLVDPEFSSSFAAAGGGGSGGGGGGGGSSSVVQDRESETESSLPPALRRLSKRPRRPLETAASAAEAEPLSSISDVSSEEDVARCLMLLSRDAWARSIAGEEAEYQQSGGCDEAGAEDEEYGDEDGEDGDDGIRGSARSRRSGRRSRYQCGTCKRFFRSYQALGGHRASHKKVAGGGCVPAGGQIGGEVFSEANADKNSSLHRCPACSRVFSSAQALGGHKRSHLASSSSATAAYSPPLPPPPLSANSSSINLSGKGFIDLNHPAPLEEEVELSALSDATVLQSK